MQHWPAVLNAQHGWIDANAFASFVNISTVAFRDCPLFREHECAQACVNDMVCNVLVAECSAEFHSVCRKIGGTNIVSMLCLCL